MKRVVATGTFDHLHPGHEFFLSEAKKLGDWLGVVIALDETVEKIKGKHPDHNQNQRKQAVEILSLADEVVLGKHGDKYAILESLKPDIIALGYDQHAFTEHLAAELRTRGLKARIVRLPSFHPEKFKSSLVKQALAKRQAK